MPSDTLPFDEDINRSFIASARQRAQRGVLMGAAVGTASIANDATFAATVQQQYNMIEADNEMKWAVIEPTEGVFNFAPGDTLSGYAQAHGMQLRGHNLCWNSYNPGWLAKGNFTPSQLYTLLETYITTVAGHFKGKVFAWDVVNEALSIRLSAGRTPPIRRRCCSTTITK
jgi:endo-1,4-beta-xylanase